MRRLTELPIRTKFFGLMSLLLIILLFVSGILLYQRQKSFAIKFAVDNARSLATEIIQTRDYISSVVKGEPEHNYSLVPQVVATQVAKRVTQNSNVYVRQVSLRYRNPENRPDSYESAKLQEFAKNPHREVYDIVRTGDRRLFRYMQPMLATASCLECHGSYEKAPSFVQKRFPPGHYSYNYRVGETIGAVSVSIPLEDLYARLGTNFTLDLATRGLIFLIVVTVMGVIMSRQIVTPVKQLSERIMQVTRTGNFHEKLPQRPPDEIGSLIGAFNEMLDELQRRSVQSQESEQRYRRLIEMAASAVVTFLKDGKIVIANQKAENLLGLTRQALLGESLFSFLAEGAALQEKLGTAAGAVEENWILHLRSADGRQSEVEAVISSTQTDRQPMFTAILRERGTT